jgi:hypothetical protein
MTIVVVGAPIATHMGRSPHFSVAIVLKPLAIGRQLLTEEVDVGFERVRDTAADLSRH